MKVDNGMCDIHVIDCYLTSTRSNNWVFDTGSVAHICNSKVGWQLTKYLKRDEVTMKVGNGSHVTVVAEGTYVTVLPSGLRLVLDKCYYVPL
jgi:hypothetical protein